MNYEERYWELREAVERAEDEVVGGKPNSTERYNVALSAYQDFCMDILEMLMDKNEDVLKNLK